MTKKKGRLLQIVVGVVVLTMIGGSFGAYILSPQGKLSVPEHFANMQKVGSVEGQDALRDINKLHGVDIELADGYQAVYIAGDKRVLVWVGQAESSSIADALLGRMVEGISNGGGSGFTDITRLDIAGNEVFETEGPGGQHFFYLSSRDSKRIVWLTIEADDAMPLVEEAVKTF